MLTEGFRGSPQLLQINVGTVLYEKNVYTWNERKHFFLLGAKFKCRHISKEIVPLKLSTGLHVIITKKTLIQVVSLMTHKLL
jgi:hypothetical protein